MRCHDRSSISVLLGAALVCAALAWARPASAQDNDECLACHGEKSLTAERRGRTVSLFVDKARVARSVHGSLPCVACHADLQGKELPHETPLAKVDCGACHGVEQQQHSASLHGRAIARKDPLAPRCATCHGAHEIFPVADPRSAVAPQRIPFVCGACHQEGTPVSAQRTIHQSKILENYSESIHGEALLKKGLVVTATCASCHTAHLVLPHTDPRSSIARKNIAATCTRCHAQIESVHQKVIRGELWEKEANVLPACPDCHQPHRIRQVFYNQGMADSDCLRCHGRPGLTASSDGRSLTVDQNEVQHSSHAKIACSQCHAGVNTSRARACETITGKVDCATCHEAVGQEFAASRHGTLLAQKDPNAPACVECHGTHGVKGRKDPSSPTFPTRIPDLCARCHREGSRAAVRRTGPEREIVERYTESIHGKGLLKSGLTVTATCSDCHTAHNVRPMADAASSVNPKNVPATCGRCHHGIEDQFDRSIHVTKIGRTRAPLPVCNDCHSAHTIRRADSDGFKLEIMQRCGRCHEAIAKTYFDTYHGKVSQLGYTKTAKCYDCHGSHEILPVSDPRSQLSHANVVQTCRNCHPGANRRFAGYLTHATHHDPAKYPYLFWVFWGMTGLLVTTFVVSGVHTLLWLPRAFQMRRERQARQQGA